MTANSLDNLKKQFRYYKDLGEKTMDQCTDSQLFWQYNEESNSLAIIAKHIAGNMLSRWTDFMTSDGEKEWRNRETEFINEFQTREEILEYWHKGWDCLYKAIDPLTEADLDQEVFIRNMGCTVLSAIHRQLAHYAYHIGQMVFIGKMLKDDQWQSLSIPRGASKAYNAERFKKEKTTKHFTDDK